jgi:hypothetical protein
MNTEQNSEQILDQTIAGILAEEMDSADVQQAAARVWTKLAQEARVSQDPNVLRTCDDFRALIPAYRSKQLPDAQAWLFEDHVHSCAACRVALDAARSGKVAEMKPRAKAHWALTPQSKWAMAAALAIGIGIGSWQMRDNLLPSPAGARGTVESVNGFLYRVSDSGSTPLVQGAELSEREEILTARGSSAMVRLADGSLVEMRERSGLSLSRKRSGMTIRVARGSVIVQAAKQRTGRLYVATNDFLVSVKGTVFAVDCGTKGSRVAVLQGVVQVDEANQKKLLHPGEQLSTSDAMAPAPIKDEIAWSRDVNQHLALLGEFTAMQKQLEQLPGPGLRYSSALLPLVPAGTVLYVAIPNIGGMVANAQQIFQERLNQSQALSNWWNSQHDQAKLTQLLNTVQAFSSYLGNEVVFTVAEKSAGQYAAPLVMAQVTASGFLQYLQQQVSQIPGGVSLTIVTDPSALPAAPVTNGALVLLMNGIVAVSPDPASLRAVATLIQQPGSGAFAQSAFYQQIAAAYQAGAEWLVCVDMEQILPQSVGTSEKPAMLHQLGVSDVQHLLVERKEMNGKTENRAVMTFSHQRRGIAAWLAAPAPMGAIDFVSPDASFVASFVVIQPQAALQELFNALQSVDPNFTAQEAKFESETGISVLNDLAAPLGGDIAFALDGPVLPTPSWKFAIEVYNPVLLQNTIQTLVTKASQMDSNAGLSLTQSQVSGRTYYTLQSTKSTLSVNYTFVDGYLVAAASQALLTQAISQHAAGITLTRSAAFKSLLAPDGQSNFSALVYQNLGPVLNSLAGGLQAVAPGQQDTIAALKANAAPSLVYAYGQPDRIELASSGSFFGFNLDSVGGAGGPFQVPALLEKALGSHRTQ